MAKRFGIALALIVALGIGMVLVTKLLVNPMASDLAVVGKGTPALVLAYENYSPTGGDALTRLNRVRGDYEDRMVFVVADMGTPQGETFVNRHRLVEGAVVLLDRAGKPISVDQVPEDEQALRRQLDDGLAQLEAAN